MVSSEGQFPHAVGLQSVVRLNPARSGSGAMLGSRYSTSNRRHFRRSLAKCIGALRRETVRDPLRHLNLQRVIR